MKLINANDNPSLDEGKSGECSKLFPVAQASTACEVVKDLISNLNHSAINTNPTLIRPRKT